jgi:hypothetical protein
VFSHEKGQLFPGNVLAPDGATNFQRAANSKGMAQFAERLKGSSFPDSDALILFF